MILDNPYRAGNPVGGGPAFVGREDILRSVVRLLTHKEENAIVLFGQRRIGKTSVLLELAQRLPDEGPYHPLYFDLQDKATQPLGQVLQELAQRIATLIQMDAPTDWPDDVPTAFRTLFLPQVLAQANQFGTFNLEVLLDYLYERDRRLILLLDEFDQLIHHPVLNSAEFFGGMRALATRSRGLDLVIASRLPLARLHEATQPLNPTGSPFFNNFAEFVMGPFPDKDINDLLNQGDERFTPQDRRSIRLLAGGHPFLLQAAAEAVWDAFDEGIEGITERRRYAGQRLFREHRHLFADSWRNWTPEMRQAYTVVGLATLDGQLGDRQFKMKKLLDSLTGLSPELDDFAQSGLLVADATLDAKWKVPQQVMLWWLADELVRALRSEDAFAQWLRSEELEGRWTQGQRSQIKDAVNRLGRGAMELIERFASNINTNLGGA